MRYLVLKTQVYINPIPKIDSYGYRSLCYGEIETLYGTVVQLNQDKQEDEKLKCALNQESFFKLTATSFWSGRP